MDGRNSIGLIDALGGRSERASAAVALAKHFGAEALYVFIPDPDRPGTRIPAAGFPSAPSMRGWRELLRANGDAIEVGVVAYPDAAGSADATAYAFGSITFVLVGVSRPRSEVRTELASFARVLATMFASEIENIGLRGQLEVERLAAERSNRLAESLDRARGQAEHAMRAKDEFLAMLGHELRNPLAPIVTALQLMRMDGLDTRAQDIIERHVAHVMRLVDDLLDVSRITSGKIELRKQPLELAPVVTRAIEMAKPLLERQRNKLSVEVPEQGVVVDGDPARLAQIISNLVTNAAKYSDAGSAIEIRVARVQHRIRLEVADEGIGLDPDHVDRVFEQFMQVPQGLDRAAGGLGLGLAIVRSLVERHGGTVHAHSEGVGRGSTFIVELPACDLAPRSELATRPEQVRPKGHARVLVVDDNEDAADMLGQLLTVYGYDVETANSGPDALGRLERFSPNIAVLDIGLPVMDGYELAGAVRGRIPGIKLVALTGYGQANDHARSRAAGFDAHLVKPVAVDVLARTLEQFR